MNKEIDKYISVLQSGVDNCDNTKIAADFLLSKDSEYLSKIYAELGNEEKALEFEQLAKEWREKVYV